MKSNSIINEEVSRMKSLFGYQRGRVISEQEIQEIGFGSAIALQQQQKQQQAQQSSTPPPIPTELKDIEGVKKFQDWLDENKKGWASGYTNGVLNKIGKGYGRMGPRTTKAWGLFKDKFLNPTKLTSDITQQEIDQINAGTQPKDVAAVNSTLIKPGETANDYYRNPDGTIKVNDLEPVTVTAKKPKQVTAQPVATDATASTEQKGPKPEEPGQPGEYRDGWSFDEKSQQWY